MSCADLFLALIAVLFPPLAVWVKSGLCTADSFINIALCCLGYVPGLIHAWYIIAKNPEHNYDYEPIADERGGRNERVTYYYVSHQPGPQQPGHQAGPGYGTQGPNKPPPPVPQQRIQAGAAAGPSTGAGSGEEGAPPSYTDVVKGDHKVQRQE